jgi:hypothetical protein
MTSAEELRAKAMQLYDQADKAEDATERLGYVLRALELETDADVMEREQLAAQGQVQPKNKE